MVGWEGWGCWLAEELDEARLAVRVVAMLLEGALVQQFEAKCAREVFRVPLATHRSYTLSWREGEREGEREGGRERGREGGREGGRERGREGGRERRIKYTVVLTSLRTPLERGHLSNKDIFSPQNSSPCNSTGHLTHMDTFSQIKGAPLYFPQSRRGT